MEDLGLYNKPEVHPGATMLMATKEANKKNTVNEVLHIL
jgi:hypothetical protein